MDFIWQFVLNALIFYLVFKLGQWVLVRRIAESISQQQQETQQEEIQLKLERCPEGLFAYSKLDGSFVANHTDFEGLLSRIRDRFPGRSFRLSKPDWASEREYADMFTAAVRVFGSSPQ